MRDFQLYVTDDRYAVRTVVLLSAEDEAMARLAARGLLGEPHHVAVEVWEQEDRLFSVGAVEAPRALSSVASSRDAIRGSMRLIRNADPNGALISPDHASPPAPAR